MPKKALYASLSELATYLTRRCHTDVECAYAIFVFVTSLNVDAILEGLDQTSPEDSVVETLVKMQKNMINLAFLYQELARYLYACSQLDVLTIISNGLILIRRLTNP